jgi:anti-sigma factor RsiW
MPEAVRARVMARLHAAGARPAPARTARWPGFRWPALGFGLGAACAAALSLLILAPDRQSLTGEIVAAHIRALQPGHLQDVASTDQHTVKPWFDGKIDFAPPVEDFTAKGYPLVGGRIDYVGGRPVAALIYRRDKHVIDLFVWPAAGGSGPFPGRAAAAQGYNVVHWRGEGMDFWAVSDVEPTQLNDFAGLWPHAG